MKTYTDRERSIKNEWLKAHPEVNRRHAKKSYYRRRLKELEAKLDTLKVRYTDDNLQAATKVVAAMERILVKLEGVA